eukprot:CAMPEP_0185333392 /NCGR_PEP_ID=MMETSP1363-20130426/83285_1 /TAXON_ID=38817 /ORGANISM="Gephyrocapsa oceanica, Strain RCC1303" /LENGTH=92 /DNA_ID=CAMNT_0027932325 /DNA_START=9 /DNA_END=284 /DNA_ORIENTATION=+
MSKVQAGLTSVPGGVHLAAPPMVAAPMLARSRLVSLNLCSPELVFEMTRSVRLQLPTPAGGCLIRISTRRTAVTDVSLSELCASISAVQVQA